VGGARIERVVWFAVLKKYVLVPFSLFLAAGVFWTLVPRLFTKASAPKSAAVVQPPTATEVFALRSKCAELGDKIRDGDVIGSNLTQSVVSHYEPTTNRCYVELTVQTADTTTPLAYLHRVLYDGQTNEMLAFTRVERSLKTGQIFVKAEPLGDTAFEQANGFIDKIMEDDRTR